MTVRRELSLIRGHIPISYAIRDALASIEVTKVEIHISDITKREEFRKVSVTAPACDAQIYGHGLEGYLEAIDFCLKK